MAMIFCHKLQQTLPALPSPPLPGPLGQRIFEQISAEAFKGWIIEQTKLINELKLNLRDPAAQKVLEDKMMEYFFDVSS